MKNLCKFVLVLGVFLSSFAFGQKNESLLIDDKVVEYFRNQYQFISNGNYPKDLKIFQQNPTQENVPYFYDAFKTNEREFAEFSTKQNELVKYIEKNYKLSSYSDKERADLISELVEEIIVEIPGPIIIDGGNVTHGCLGVYIAECTIAAAAAYAGHVACAGADVATLGGSAAICHGFVVAAQIAAIYIAAEDYNDCKNGK